MFVYILCVFCVVRLPLPKNVNHTYTYILNFDLTVNKEIIKMKTISLLQIK